MILVRHATMIITDYQSVFENLMGINDSFIYCLPFVRTVFNLI